MRDPRDHVHPSRRSAVAASSSIRRPILVSSLLHAGQQEVWDRVASVRGINDELRPLFRMTAPARLRERGLDAVPVGERVCRSWVLLLGVLPVDYDDITVVRLDPPRGFLERSTMLSQSLWEHERTIEPAAGGCLLTDRVSYQPRIPVADRLLRVIYSYVFRHRHRRLRRRFGGREA